MTCAPHKKAKCAQCGKKFMRTNDHVYKREDHGTRWYCSYTCFRVKAREEEQRERERLEKAEQMHERLEKLEAEYQRRKREIKGSGKEERVVCRSLTDAQTKLEDAELKIKQYEQAYTAAAQGTYEKMQAQRNLARWRRKRKYLWEEVTYFWENEEEE